MVCCKNWNVGVTVICHTVDNPFKCGIDEDMSYDDAVTYCASKERRLCTKAELLSDICCTKQVDPANQNCDSYPVWTNTPDI